MGCTILRDSKLVLILDPREIIGSYKQSSNIQIQGQGKKGNVVHHNILVIDDSAIQRDNLKNILKRAGYNVDTAENGFEALKASRNKNYSAFCVDIVMPLMDGYEFIERLRKIDIYKHTPVFLITLRDTSFDENRSANLNIAKSFVKPVDEDLFIGYLKECLEKENS